MQKADDLMTAIRKGLCLTAPMRIGGKESRIMLLEHAGAGARRCDDVLEAFESGDHLFRDLAGILEIAAIESRLPTARLQRRHLNATPRILQQLDRGESDVGSK